MIGENWIAHRDVACDTLIEASIRKNAKSSGKMLLAIQSLLFQGAKFWVRSNCEVLSGGSRTKSAELLVAFRSLIEDCQCRGHL